MKATLIKTLDNGWPIYFLRREDGRMIATTRFPFDEPALMIAKNVGIELQKLSHENCDEIFGIITSEALMKDVTSNCDITKEGFILGFQVAMELNKDKQFTLEDMKRAISFGQGMDLWKEEEQIDKFIQSRQQPTEIEVEVEMEKVVDETKVVGAVKGVKGSGDKITTYKSVPKLDENGCLMLKKEH